jgi:hypothetical protein
MRNITCGKDDPMAAGRRKRYNRASPPTSSSNSKCSPHRNIRYAHEVVVVKPEFSSFGEVDWSGYENEPRAAACADFCDYERLSLSERITPAETMLEWLGNSTLDCLVPRNKQYADYEALRKEASDDDTVQIQLTGVAFLNTTLDELSARHQYHFALYVGMIVGWIVCPLSVCCMIAIAFGGSFSEVRKEEKEDRERELANRSKTGADFNATNDESNTNNNSNNNNGSSVPSSWQVVCNDCNLVEDQCQCLKDLPQ